MTTSLVLLRFLSLVVLAYVPPRVGFGWVMWHRHRRGRA